MSDALVRKTSVTDANASYVEKLRVADDATNEEIQTALHQLFNSSPQGIKQGQAQLGPQGHSVLQYPQGTNSMNEDTSPQDNSTNKSILASTAISKVQLDNIIKNSITSALQSEVPYSEILTQLQGGMRQIVLNDLIFKI